MRLADRDVGIACEVVYADRRRPCAVAMARRATDRAEPSLRLPCRLLEDGWQ
jgi:hypothetical protein